MSPECQKTLMTANTKKIKKYWDQIVIFKNPRDQNVIFRNFKDPISNFHKLWVSNCNFSKSQGLNYKIFKLQELKV